MSEVEERNYTQERLQSVERPVDPQLPAAPEKPKSGGSGRGITFAVLLIGLGIALLLSNLGIIAFSWAVLLNFWPVVLILIGLDVMLGGRSAAGSALLALVSLMLVMGVIFWASRMPAPAAAVEHPIELALDGANSLDVHLELGAGNTTVEVLDEGNLAAQGTFRGSEDILFQSSITRNGNVGTIDISQGEGFTTPDALIGELELALTNAVPINLMVEAGIGELNLYLTDLLLETMNVNAGAGNVLIDLPDQGSYTVDIDAGVGNVEISVPDDMEAQIEIESGLGNVELDDRFEEISDGVWQTENYQEGAANTVDMTIDAGVGSVDISD